MQLEEINHDILHVGFSTVYDLSYTFLRFQEHYENPHFKGKVFTRDEFTLWYVKKNKKFDYYEWDGFNIPSSIFEKFYNGIFDPLEKEEQDLLKLLIPYRSRNFYVIGTCASNQSFNHEMAHGLFYTNSDYKTKSLQILSSMPKKEKEKINSVLLDMGYDHEFLDDETQAYFVGGVKLLNKNGLKDSRTEEHQKAMKALFREYKKR